MMDKLKNKKGFICDMDGVIYHGRKLLAGADEFVAWLKENNKKFLFLTNSSERSPKELQQKLNQMGIYINPDHFITSAMATASFLASQCPGGKVYVIGEPALVESLIKAGLSVEDSKPDYVVVGETKSYGYDKIETAINLVLSGARLIGTNSDLTGPIEKGIKPGCRSLVAPIELATGKQAYFIGKPNPLIMRHSLKKLRCRHQNTVIIGDRMDTDIIAGIESEIETVLVLSGVTHREDISHYSYRPHYILNGVGEICE